MKAIKFSSQIHFFLRKNFGTNPEQYLKIKTSPNVPNLSVAEYTVPIQKFEKGKKYAGLKEEERPIPISPYLGPIKVSNPIVNEKKYFWCSCGMSLKQVLF